MQNRVSPCGWQAVTSKNSDWRFTATLAPSFDSAAVAFEVAKDAKTARPIMRRESIVRSLTSRKGKESEQRMRRKFSEELTTRGRDLSKAKVVIAVQLCAYLPHQGLHPWTTVDSRVGHTKNLAEACQLEHCEGVVL
jgi:hypothetical protein